MGLFGSIIKGIGKVAGGVLRGVAAKATGGLSEVALRAFNKLKGSPDRMGGQAAAAKYAIFEKAPRGPRVTEHRALGGPLRARRRMRTRFAPDVEAAAVDRHMAAARIQRQAEAALRARSRNGEPRRRGRGPTHPKVLAAQQQLKQIAARWRARGKSQGTGMTWRQFVQAEFRK